MSKVRIATWNLENLFRPRAPAGPTSEAAYEAKLDSLATTIAELAPDVLAVQEVGDPAALKDLRKRLDGYRYQATADPDGRGIRVGFLSRYKLIHLKQVSKFPRRLRPIQVDDTRRRISSMGRPALVAAVRIGGMRIDLVNCHLKSKLLTFPGGRFSTTNEGERARFAGYALNRRAAEAITVRAAATKLLADKGQDSAVVVLGDLNDEAVAATTQILQGPPGSEIGTPGYGRKDGGDGQRLWNLAGLILEEAPYTRRYRGRPELIDHILASHALVSRLTPGAVRAGPGDVSIDDNPNTRRGAPGSDHRPVVADLDLS